MENLLIPLKESDVRELECVASRINGNKDDYIETIDDKDFIKYETLYLLFEELTDEIDRLKEELYEKEDEENGKLF